MEKSRMQEIALALVRYKLSHEGIRVHANMNRDLGNVAKATGVPQSELKEFGKILLKDFLKKSFG